MKRIVAWMISCLSVVVCVGQYAQLTNIPTIYIETYGNKAVTSKTTYVYATMTYVDGDNVVQYDSLQIRGRGNSTWGLAKKPYRIKFNESTKFLGKGYAKNKSWTLLANHGDKSLLRNAVTFTMGDFLGQPFSPAALFVDLYLNGTYLGNYQVSDQVNVDNKRVEIYEQEEVATDDSNITGGYLVEVDGFGSSEEVHFYTGKNLIVSVKSPDEDVINDSQRDYIKNYLDDFEALLFGSSFIHPEDGYRAVVDSATLVSWYIATELSANVDGFWSTYLYKERDDPKLYFGPLWDYDIAYNNCNRVGDVTLRDMVEAGFGGHLTKVWVKQMIQDPWFNDAVNEAWKRKVDEGLEQYLYNYIDSMATHLDRSQQKNYGKYSISSRTYNEIFLYSTYADYIAQLKRFIGEHMEFLTTRFAERANDTSTEDNPVQPLLPFELTDDYYYRIYNRGVNKVLDVADDGTGVVIWSAQHERETQLWQITQIGDCYHLVNKATGMAFHDPASLSVVEVPLVVAEPDVTDSRQLWQFVTVNENDNYNIINAYTDNVINNAGGNANDGNNVLSYTNDNRNSVSNNRQWRIVPEEIIPDYIPEEVISALEVTITEAETFLAGLSNSQIGTDIFCYPEEQVKLLGQMVADAKIFESTVPDDYILTNVNLVKQLAVASKQVLPAPDRRYVIRHKVSGSLLMVREEEVFVGQMDATTGKQYYTFEEAGDSNGVYLKSTEGLYVSLGTPGDSSMIGRSDLMDGTCAVIDVVVGDGCYYLYTTAGLMGTNRSDSGTVYVNRKDSSSFDLLCSEWLIEECSDDLIAVEATLREVIARAQVEVSAVDSLWVGDKPMQHSLDNVEALGNLIETAKLAAYTSVEEYNEMIQQLAEAIERLHVLNAPDEDVEYCLAHVSGCHLSWGDGLTFAVPNMKDVSQGFRLLPVENATNTYYLYAGGFYVTVVDTTLALTETPRGEWGQFVVNQVAPSMFTLQSVLGYLGAPLAGVVPGEPCVGDASNVVNHIEWTLVEVADEDVESSVVTLPKAVDIDYTVVYDRESEALRFLSDDIDLLGRVEVSVYTVGGCLLYTFKASENQSLVGLPSGTYIVRWMLGEQAHVVKLKK